MLTSTNIICKQTNKHISYKAANEDKVFKDVESQPTCKTLGANFRLTPSVAQLLCAQNCSRQEFDLTGIKQKPSKEPNMK